MSDVKAKVSKVTLFDLGVEGAEIERALIESEGELTPELEQRLDNFLAAGKDKMDSAAKVVRVLNVQAEFLKSEGNRLLARSKSLTSNADNLRGRMLFALKNGFDGKLKTSENTFFVGRSVVPVYIGFDTTIDVKKFAEAHPEMVKVTYEPNKDFIKSTVKDNRELPVEIKYELGTATEYLGMR